MTYIPSDKEIRERAIRGCMWGESYGAKEFDQWLAQHNRELRNAVFRKVKAERLTVMAANTPDTPTTEEVEFGYVCGTNGPTRWQEDYAELMRQSRRIAPAEAAE